MCVEQSRTPQAVVHHTMRVIIACIIESQLYSLPELVRVGLSANARQLDCSRHCQLNDPINVEIK